MRALRDLARNYTKAERDVVRAYFKETHTASAHVRWLKAQGFKEYSALGPLLAVLDHLYRKLDRGVDRHVFEELCEKLAEETKHARLIMDLLEKLLRRKLNSKDLTWLSEDKKLAKIRARYSRSYAGLLHGSERITAGEIQRKDEDLERAAITLTEGGGGALYEICSKLKGSVLEKAIAAIFKEIHRDEIKHKNSGGKALDGLIRTRRDFDRAAEIIATVSLQRLRMRNEQFGFPLSEEEIRRLDEKCRGGSRSVSRTPPHSARG